MPKYAFLSDAWLAEVRRLHAAHEDTVPAEAEIRMNLMVTETPFGPDRAMHLTAEGGRAEWGEGHLDEPDVTLTLGYETAREIFVGGNPQAAIDAFMAGRITMQGDITKLVVMQASQPGAGSLRFAQAILDVTE